MNKLLSFLACAVVAASPLAGFSATGYESDPAYLPIDKLVDLKTTPPEVNINLPRFLLKDAVSDLTATTNGPLAGKGAEFAELIKDVKLIRLVVIEASKTNRPALDQSVKALRSELESKWTPIVSVPEENVGVYAMGDPSGESVVGMAVLVYNGGDAVIGNVVGRVSIGKVIKLASQMDKLPKDLVKKLQGMAGQTNAPASSENQPKKSNEAEETPAKEAAAK
jgi:hypothetical protein